MIQKSWNFHTVPRAIKKGRGPPFCNRKTIFNVCTCRYHVRPLLAGVRYKTITDLISPEMDAGRPRPRLRSYPGLNDPQQQQLERLDHQQRSKSNISGTGNNGGASGGNGNDSPESGSLYSDEIPSGYNSGEQYDTISTGYMSGEAYELPETR